MAYDIRAIINLHPFSSWRFVVHKRTHRLPVHGLQFDTNQDIWCKRNVFIFTPLARSFLTYPVQKHTYRRTHRQSDLDQNVIHIYDFGIRAICHI